MNTVTHKLRDTAEIKPFNSFTPRSDGFVNSPHNANTFSSRWVIRKKKLINFEMLF